MSESYFAPCPRGLEQPLVAELRALGAEHIAVAEGGVAFAGELALAHSANLESRIASRILWRVGGGDYRTADDLYRIVHDIEWARHFAPHRTLRVDVAATRSPLASLEFATLRTKDAVCDRMRADRGVRPSVDKRAPDVRVHVHLTEREATIYLDTSGEPLFKRGYRQDADDAPLRENLAAGLIALTGWTPERTLLDPMCGSGTIVAEAALISAGRAPGLDRAFGFQKLAWYDGPTWQRIRQKARDRIRTTPPAAPSIFASDIAERSVGNTRSNVRHARVDGFVRVERADVLQRDAPAPEGVLLFNPPYGVRLAESEPLASFYPRLGDALKRRYAGWVAFVFTGDLRLARLIGLKPERRTPLWNGAIECRLFAFRLVAGTMRRP
jgi:23S rRNA (guanine2445-N2)-methyltransferase